jgi:hypothetical protein
MTKITPEAEQLCYELKQKEIPYKEIKREIKEQL